MFSPLDNYKCWILSSPQSETVPFQKEQSYFTQKDKADCPENVFILQRVRQMKLAGAAAKLMACGYMMEKKEGV